MGHERPASTDIQDTAGYKGPHHKVSEDERGPDAQDVPVPKTGKDVHARILGVTVHGNKTRIAIGSGPNQGVFVGAPGYLIDHNGIVHKFEITDAENSFAYAMIDAIPDQLHGNITAIVNPSSMPQASVMKKDQEARIIGVSVDGGKTRIMIGYSEQRGAAVGMKGWLVSDTGHRIVSFEIAELRNGACSAYVEATVDQVEHGAKVVLNPS